MCVRREIEQKLKEDEEAEQGVTMRLAFRLQSSGLWVEE